MQMKSGTEAEGKTVGTKCCSRLVKPKSISSMVFAELREAN